MRQHTADQSCMEARGFVTGPQNLPSGASTKPKRSCLVVEGYKTSLAESLSNLPYLLPLSAGHILGIIGERTVSTQDSYNSRLSQPTLGDHKRRLSRLKRPPSYSSTE